MEMTAGNNKWWFEISHHLGAVYPFYDVTAPEEFSLDIEFIIHQRRKRGKPIELDPVGLACKTCLPYLLGDRTLVKDVCRAPWMAHYVGRGKWEKAELPPHGHKKPDRGEFLCLIKQALIEEANSYLKGAKSVGILLSGGMDSRVVAGVVRELQISAGLPEQVVAITWGQPDSRDVFYASQIASRFNWEMHNFYLDETYLLDNIEIAGRMGAEVSPLHLHAIPRVAELAGIDVMIAGSYGDSVGRAEFSGRHLTSLKPILPRDLDKFGLLRSSFLREVLPELKKDAFSSPHISKETSYVRRREIEQESHYMRSMLQSCMLIIARRRPFYQMFTAPMVFGLMWSLDPRMRNNEWYWHLLKMLPGNLLDIPWARTGKLYLQRGGAHDDRSSIHHSYGIWLRNQLKDLVVERVKSKTIRELGIFNDHGLDNALKAWLKARTKTTNSLDEVLSWLSSLHVTTVPTFSR